MNHAIITVGPEGDPNWIAWQALTEACQAVVRECGARTPHDKYRAGDYHLIVEMVGPAEITLDITGSHLRDLEEIIVEKAMSGKIALARYCPTTVIAADGRLLAVYQRS